MKSCNLLNVTFTECKFLFKILRLEIIWFLKFNIYNFIYSSITIIYHEERVTNSMRLEKRGSILFEIVLSWI